MGLIKIFRNLQPVTCKFAFQFRPLTQEVKNSSIPASFGFLRVSGPTVTSTTPSNILSNRIIKHLDIFAENKFPLNFPEPAPPNPFIQPILGLNITQYCPAVEGTHEAFSCACESKCKKKKKKPKCKLKKKKPKCKKKKKKCKKKKKPKCKKKKKKKKPKCEKKKKCGKKKKSKCKKKKKSKCKKPKKPCAPKKDKCEPKKC